MTKHWAQRLADKDAISYGKTITGVDECQFPFTGDEFRRLIQTLLEPAILGRESRTAIVVNGLAQYGVARQFQVYFGNASEVSVSCDGQTAFEWLSQ